MDKLTELSIKQARPRKKQYKIFDGGGMFLLIHPNGSKYWRMNYNFGGKNKLASFGVWPQISLKEARSRRYEAKKKIKDGVNPIEEKRDEKLLILEKIKIKEIQKDSKNITFQSIAEEWHRRQVPLWTEKHAADVLNSLYIHVYPYIGLKPIARYSIETVKIFFYCIIPIFFFCFL